MVGVHGFVIALCNEQVVAKENCGNSNSTVPDMIDIKNINESASVC